MVKRKHDGAKVRYAESLAEIYQHIQNIGNELEKENRPLMWFRGHSIANYNLNPNIFRGAEYYYNAQQTYGNNHLREEYRFQHFMSRNFDKIDYRMPQTVIEWQEVMQHFFTKTRLMDWSESLTVSLEFALEAFINPILDSEIERQRSTAEPVIWILCPAELNKEVYRTFAYGDESLVTRVIDKRKGTIGLDRRIREELREEEKSGIYYNLQNENEHNMNAMISLSSLEIIRSAYKGRELEALRNFEINPFFYLLLRYYSDGVPAEMGKLPPLAIIHPYHSQRIKSQQGVFTVFPHYIPNEMMVKMKKLTGKYPPVGMEYMSQCIPYLYKIQIVNPEKVAKELIMTGARRGNLYPDMQVISQDFENVVR